MYPDAPGSDGGSSPLSSACSLSPPPSTEFFYHSRMSYPSPSASQRSSAKASPAPDLMSQAPSGEDDGPPPAKRRKISEPKPRTTERLDLRYGEVSPEDKPQLDRLLKVLHKKRKIVVIAGAGISVSAGSEFSPNVYARVPPLTPSQSPISVPPLACSSRSGRAKI